MKHSILATLLVTALTAMSCGESNLPNTPDKPNGETGQVAMSLSANKTFINVKSKSAEDDLDVKTFKVNIKKPGGESYKAWASYAEVESVVTLEAGTYELEAYNGEQKNAAFEAPYFYGSKAFTVTPQEMSNVSMECKLMNVKITVEFAPNFLDKVDNILVTVDNNENGILPWTADETRAGYFKIPSSKTVNVVATGINKATGEVIESQTTPISSLAPQQWHKVTIDIATAGSLEQGITVNTELIEKDVTIEVPDADDVIDNNGDNGIWDPTNPEPGPDPEPEPEPAGAPTIVGESFKGAIFDIATPLEISISNPPTVLDVLFKSSTGIQNLILEIVSNELTEILPGEMDLANPDVEAVWYGMFADPMIGLIDPNVSILGKKEHRFSVGGLMSLLTGICPAGSDQVFKLKVVDANGTTTASLTLKVVE